MDFSLTQEQRELRESAIRFAEAELNDSSGQPEPANFPGKAWRKCADFGIQGLAIPSAFGGQGADLLTTTIVLEALGQGCRDNGLLFSLNAHMWSCALPILKFGSESQKTRYLPGLCDGSLIGVQAVTETGSGSDAMAVATTADREGDHYVINGAKTFITNAPVAGVFIVLARADADRGPAGLCALLVDRDVPGVEVGPPQVKLGLESSPMADVLLRDCRVPATALLGDPDAGMTVFSTTIEWERTFILAAALGTMRRQLDEAIAHATGHQRFGQPIGRNQAVANRIVDMRVNLEASRLLMYHTAWLKDQRKRTALESSIVKLFLSDAFVASSMNAFETYGAYAYMSGSPQEQDLRDALAGRIYSGTSDIQRVIIARMLGL